jgi:hypothetical protein
LEKRVCGASERLTRRDARARRVMRLTQASKRAGMRRRLNYQPLVTRGMRNIFMCLYILSLARSRHKLRKKNLLFDTHDGSDIRNKSEKSEK